MKDEAIVTSEYIPLLSWQLGGKKLTTHSAQPISRCGFDPEIPEREAL
jgi:hypothetical protein